MEIEEDNNNDEEKKKVLTILFNYYNSNSLDKKTSISKDDYDFLYNYFIKINDEIMIRFIDYLNDVHIPIIKILIDGYIKFDFEENKVKLILDNLAKIIKVYFNKKIFKCVYRHFSKFFRKNILLKDINKIKQFEKTFNLWKLIYNIENNLVNQKKENILKYNNFEIYIKNKDFFGENYFLIEIYFTYSQILNKLKSQESFYFMTLYDDNNLKMPFSFKNLFDNTNNLDNAELLGKSNKIVFIFSKKEFSVFINQAEIKKLPNGNPNFNYNSISKIKILNYFFYGEIFQINIKMKNVTTSEKSQDFGIITKILDIFIKKETFSSKYTHNLNFMFEDEKNNVEIKLNLNNLVEFKNLEFGYDREWKGRKKRLENIKYYGGIECFIPLFKIIKYIIFYLGNSENNKEKEIVEYLDKCIVWIKDILKTILRLICLNRKNYLNFKESIIPLIGAFAEISHILNNLILSGAITEDYKKSLFNDEIIYSLFIAIIYFRINKNVIEMYKQIFEMKEKWNIKFNMEYILLDINYIKDSKFYWYFSVLFNYALFILIYNDSVENSPKSIIDHIDKIIANKKKRHSQIIDNFILSANQFINLIKGYYSNSKEKNYQIQYSTEYLKSNNYYLKLLINLIKTVLNVKFLSKINQISFNNDPSYIMKLISLLNENKVSFYKTDSELTEIKESFHKYFDDAAQLEEWIGLKVDKVIYTGELLTNELVDYHGEYHRVMKELFIFNRLWSKEKVFFSSFEKKIENLKYKHINYYTRNFQRSIVYPVLDYKYRYPDFSLYKIQDGFYRNEEKEKEKDGKEKLEDDYNFNLDCPEFDEIVKKYNTEIFIRMKKKSQNSIEIFNVCLVKQLSHIKGTLFLIFKKNKFKLVFFSYSYDFENKKEYSFKCNKSDNIQIKSNFNYEKNLKELCFGQIFKSQEKDKNRKIELGLKNIRMLLYKRYYYRKSAIEIFTENKSYLFNFVKQEDFIKFSSIIESFLEGSETLSKSKKEQIYYMPININSNKIGYLKTNKKCTKNDFLEFISNNGDINDMCFFDIVMFCNLVANRTFLDLNQYPVFPVLFFYDKSKKTLERNLKLHIGFQALTEEGKRRCELTKSNYNDNKKARENEEEEEEEEEKEDIYYFNTHYSNIVYTNNYLIRLFPYSFGAIEIQGNYFDDPNRLFFSIEKLLFNISGQISDLRELIPEFYYLPEMYVNLNNLNFLSLQNGNKVDDVIIPDNIIQEEISTNNQKTNTQNEKKNNLFRIFLFIQKMKNYLENTKDNLSYWLNLIFGTQQKYLKKKNGQLFRTESYVDIDDETFKKYSNNDIIMKSVEFGLIPTQIIFDSKSLNNIKNRKSLYNKTRKNQKIVNNFEDLDTKDTCFIPNLAENYWDNSFKLSFKLKNGNGVGKLKVLRKNDLLTEIIDHSDEINCLFYNRRLNMFATSSYDGLVCVYMIPNKLISVIKNPNNIHYKKVFLSANPFPTIILYEKYNGYIFSSYSLSGIFINKLLLQKNKFDIILHFDVYGGSHKDRIEICYKKPKVTKIFDLPFFQEVK